ncbi:Uncharacterised protein [Sebaldella termitidis]|uniref:Uncharacterized protein n=1 Tax=Sebaldella termitidis (strain ATCC 33386 / NCTC 11300) TaxID=526218 RepID=D1AHE4_SEBTE|nr:hypothetical protein [Sebaldella termitidis]ACZ08178.1 hypothetical protein Sterm_1312 [Sebaldella termitidis ATCC 33386]SUI23481.1 Uncharacterised protein [Sebaldella termitidis]
MLIKLDSSIVELNRNYEDEEIYAIQKLINLVRKRYHLIYSKYEVLEKLSKIEDLGCRDRKIFEKLATRIRQKFNFYEKNFKKRLLIYIDTPKEKKSKNDIQIELKDFDKIDETKTNFLVEGKDITFFDFIVNFHFENFNKKIAYNYINTYDEITGGGNTTADNFRKLKKNKIVICVCDSDRDYKNCRLGDTAKKIKKVKILCHEIAHLMILEEKAIENLIPRVIYNPILENKSDFLDKLEKEKEFEYIKHLDFKKGMKKKRFLECKEYKKFWKLKIEEFFKEELDKKLDDLDEESCVIEKVSENLLNSVNKRIETGKINIEYSSLSDYHKKRWQEIAEELICWFICETNPI